MATMREDIVEVQKFIVGMKEAYARGENMMRWHRAAAEVQTNSTTAALIAYDLQAGSYVETALRSPGGNKRWCAQLADLIRPIIAESDTIVEVGVGEATTLCGVLKELKEFDPRAFGFDLSWSRVKTGQEWIDKGDNPARLFVADLFNIPLGNSSVDIVYTSHSLEPNGGKEQAAVSELLRVARKAVVLVEPIYELASDDAKARMASHGYARGLKGTALNLGAQVVRYELLKHTSNPLNPSGVVMLKKDPDDVEDKSSFWQCPVTGTPLEQCEDVYCAHEVGIAYPILRGVPLLRPEHAVVASKLCGGLERIA